MNKSNKIRCSMLPGYIDCSRMAVANGYRDMLQDAGYDLPVYSTKKIYTVIGTCTHHASEYMCTKKIEGKHSNDVYEFTEDKFLTELKTAESLEYEKITPNQEHAQYQIRRFIYCFQRDILPKLRFPENASPKDHLELFLKAKIREYDITGHVDIMTAASICDTKTGNLLKPCHTQVGGYNLLAKSNYDFVPKNNIIFFMPRVHKDKNYPGTQIIKLNPDFCTGEAYSLINRIIDDMEEFKKSGNPRAFVANPQSILCNKKYCRAFGTSFCEYY